MRQLQYLKSMVLGGASLFVLGTGAFAAEFNIPGGDLKSALDSYAAQTGVSLIVSGGAIKNVYTHGAEGELTADVALSRILTGTGFVSYRNAQGEIGIVPGETAPRTRQRTVEAVGTIPTRVADASTGIESVVVTSSKIKGDIQTVPIAITALSQEQLTSRQIAGGPDLVKEVPNLTFSKTNFTGYNIQIRGIGTQAISVTTDPAVAVAFNDTPFIRNHFFEQEFYDVSQVEVLRGPQGTLYGRNATAGVVNVISAKPTDQFEATASADIGNYHNRRYEGMINIPVVDDRVDIRAAVEWTKRDGYSFNELTNRPIDGRDLWSSRITIGWKPLAQLQTYLVWEHFQENDDRMRSAKQLCKTDPGLSEIDGVPSVIGLQSFIFSQGCLPTGLYGADAFEVPNGGSLPYVFALVISGLSSVANPYASVVQSHNLRMIESAFDPVYKAKNDIIEFNVDYNLTPALTFTSQTGFNHDFLWGTEDYNRFNTIPGIFNPAATRQSVSPTGVFCDPQLGCSDRAVLQDLSEEHAWQISQEFRLSSNFAGPFNFSAGANYLHYETQENYYVFINALTLYTIRTFFYGPPWVPGVSDNHECIMQNGGYIYPDVNHPGIFNCSYTDPNPLSSLNNQGHNYFLNQNPYVLNSYSGFGEGYYDVASDLKLTAGLRWTVDRKHFIEIPSELLVKGRGYPSTGVVDQKWGELTGRLAANWTPKLDFTDQTLLYGSYARGYKAGGANPPGAVFLVYDAGSGEIGNPVHPLTFRPEFVNAFELGSKNTLLDGAITLNGDVFYYDYKAYQISEIVDRSAINLNFDATVKGAELETTWEPAAGLKFSFAGGYEDTRVANGSKAVDLMDRAAGMPGWVVMKPFATQASNCIMPAYVLTYQLTANAYAIDSDCGDAYNLHLDPVTGAPYIPNPPGPNRHGDPIPPGAYAGFNPLTAPNNGAGFDKDLSGNELPNAPHFTTSFTAEYTMPVSQDWAATLHGDFYWQSQSFARIFNDVPYDKIRGYSNVNLALILTSADGWQVLGYLKNIFDTTAITGAFLNSDDTGLTTNVFLTDPRLFGVRVTKNF